MLAKRFVSSKKNEGGFDESKLEKSRGKNAGLRNTKFGYSVLICNRMVVRKLPKPPLLHFLALCDLPETLKNRNFFPHAGTVEENT